MFSRLFILALLVLVDLSVDAAPVLNSDQNRMEETRKEHEEALKTYRQLAQKEPETYLPEVAQTLNDLWGLWIAPRTVQRRPGRLSQRH
jgi:hypothetical protein